MNRLPVQAERLPLVVFEDDHLLVVHKPAGLNTHAPSPFAGEGLYDWLRHREPRWAALAIMHRLDKDTSGVLVFSKSELANRSLTRQFTERRVHKKYWLLSNQRPPRNHFTVESQMARRGEVYASVSAQQPGELAVTRFAVRHTDERGQVWMEAEPLTGRTHQIRVHAAENGFPILGDARYGGSPAGRVCLHAYELSLRHPATDKPMRFTVPANFGADARLCRREALIDPALTNVYRLNHGAAEGSPVRGWFVDRLGDHLLSATEGAHTAEQEEALQQWCSQLKLGSLYFKAWQRRVRGAPPEEASPRLVFGDPAPDRFTVRENGVRFELSFAEGYSVGLFLDQRDNRRRFLINHVAADFPLFPEGATGRRVLNTFAYTCGFSVCAALAGARTTSLDLSKKYLEWGRRNLALNHLDTAAHDFIYGDAFDWLRRLARKQRRFDAIVLDPPTFSQSKDSGVFRAEKDYGRLAAAALPLLDRNGVLLASTNAATLSPEDFLGALEHAVAQVGRRVLQRHYVPQPPDFPISRDEPAYLKTVWLRIR